MESDKNKGLFLTQVEQILGGVKEDRERVSIAASDVVRGSDNRQRGQLVLCYSDQGVS